MKYNSLGQQERNLRNFKDPTHPDHKIVNTFGSFSPLRREYSGGLGETCVL